MRKYALFAALALCATVALSRPAKKINLPPPGHTPSANNRPQVVARPSGAEFKLPPGFQVAEWADGGFEKPRFMLEAPGGEILLADSGDDGKVFVLADKDKDGKADSARKTLITGFYRPFGMAFWKDYLYVAGTTTVKRYKFDAKAVTVGEGQEVVSMKDFAKGHWTRAIQFDSKGEKMYVSVGSASNVEAGEPRERAAINRYNPDGSGHEVWAEGLRNPVSIRWYPRSQRLFASVQERDLLGDDLVPDYLTEVKPGGFYGWPYAYIGPNEDPRRKGEKPALVAKTIEPDLPLGAHVAVLDFIFYTGKMFPKQYQGGAFLALHGSWNRSKRVGYSIVYAPFKGGKPTGEIQDVLTGWMLAPDKREVWGRPVGILQLADGSLLVTDDGGNKVWRISFKG
jgi:glucose/arabinose dehydrogenase